MDVNVYLRSISRLSDVEKPTLIYSEKMFRWVPDPLLTFKLAYNALSPGGYLLIDEIYNGQMPILGGDNVPIDPKLLEVFLRDGGYDVRFDTSPRAGNGVVQAYAVTMRKTVEHPTLRLPIRYVAVEDVGLALDDSRGRWGTPFESVHPGITVLYRFCASSE